MIDRNLQVSYFIVDKMHQVSVIIDHILQVPHLIMDEMHQVSALIDHTCMCHTS